MNWTERVTSSLLGFLMKSNSLNKIYCNFQKINFEVKDITTSIAMREAGVLVVCLIKIA